MKEVENVENLDRLCAETGNEYAEQTIRAFNGDPSRADALLTKALGVLQEQGLYAFSLFCLSRSGNEKTGANKIEQITMHLLKNKLHLIGGDKLLAELRQNDGLASSSKFGDLTLAIQVIEKALVYARYHSKAKKGK